MPIILIGNKADLGDRRTVSVSEAKKVILQTSVSEAKKVTLQTLSQDLGVRVSVQKGNLTSQQGRSSGQNNGLLVISQKGNLTNLGVRVLVQKGNLTSQQGRS